jgi:hypothetical protein
MNILSASAGTLKVLDLTLNLYPNYAIINPPIEELCEELEAMAVHNMLENILVTF